MKNKIEISFEKYNNQISVLGDWELDSKVVVKIGKEESLCIVS